MEGLNPNAVSGLASNLNTQEIVGRFMDVEKRRIAPVEARRDKKLEELESWNVVNGEVQKLLEVSKRLTSNDIWEAKIVESSDPDIIFPTVTRGAEPGKTKIAVDAVALAHQITSQGFESPNENIGTGTIFLRIGDEEDVEDVKVPINASNNTLEGMRRAINDADLDLEAFVINTGSSERPYQLMLTSKVTGEEGRIYVDVQLEGGDVPPPTYESRYDTDVFWEGLERRFAESTQHFSGSSSPIVASYGEYTGQEEIVIKFSSSRSGAIDSEEGASLSWNDNLGRSGTISLNKFNYTPGNPIEVVDGVNIMISDGYVIPGDSFTVKATPERSSLLWWLSEEERAPKVHPPSDWALKDTDGGIKVKGKYEGEVQQTVIFRVEGNGQVGGHAPLLLHYEFTETGERGTLNIAYPYQKTGPEGSLEEATAFDFVDGEGLFTMDFELIGGNPKLLSIGQGIEIEVPPGILNDGDTATIEVNPEIPNSLWWLPEDERGFSDEIDAVAKWYPYLDDDGNPISRANVKDGILPFGAKRSTAPIEIGGTYNYDIPLTYTFQSKHDGSVGVTRELIIEWSDNIGNTGQFSLGTDYKEGTPIPFGEGLTVAFGRGRIYLGDTFKVGTETSTLQVPQDAILRLGASDLGGGIEVRRPTNTVDDVIPGVTLELLATSEDPVTITVKGDTEGAKEAIRDFVEAYNTLSTTITELTKYDVQANEAAPLLSDRNVQQLYNDIAETTIEAIPGLPQTDNMLFTLGLRLDEKGMMTLDESTLNSKIEEDFSKVANIFRSNGVSSNSKVNFIGLSRNTNISPEGYKVDVTQAATRGYYKGQALGNQVQVTSSNNELIITANGRRSEPIRLRPDTYSVASLAREIQSKLADDRRLGSRNIRVQAEDGALKIISGSFGSSSTIEVEAAGEKEIRSLGLQGGQSVPGVNVEGTIDEERAIGRGQLLLGAEKTKADGMRLLISMTEEDLTPGIESEVVVTKGIAVTLDDLLEDMANPISGTIKGFTGDIGQQVKAFEQQIRTLTDRMTSKRQSLLTKFAKLEGTLGKLKSEQSYLGQQLSQLGGGAPAPKAG